MKEVTTVYLMDVITGDPIELGDIEGNVIIAFDKEAAMPSPLDTSSSTSSGTGSE
ncbi:MAG: hypothetical protein GY861_28135 [bacterium]|nr:hypothetical protein [bacterium]